MLNTRVNAIVGATVIGLGLLLSGQPAHAYGGELHIIPKPQHITRGTGDFVLRPGQSIAVPQGGRSRWIGDFLRRHIDKVTGVSTRVVTAPAHGQIVLRIDPAVVGKATYHLTVSSRGIVISAKDDRGLFWGVQTLRQLLPVRKSGKSGDVKVPSVSIEDSPRYKWRGVMIDTVRHFFPVSVIEKQIALMSYYKFDVFHWHLTGDQGWRIQIKRYPRLTSVGAWRLTSAGGRYGGFYTQKQIREVVRYARERNVMVVPEIEMPGHTVAAIAAYPNLSCAGKRVPVLGTYGGRGDIHTVDCVTKASTYHFLDNVLSEVADLFPSPYISIGSDEVRPGAWAKCTTCMKLAKSLRLQKEPAILKGGAESYEPGLHSYFVRKIQKYLQSKGKTLIGWSEIMEGGMDSSAVVEEWLGTKGTKRALVNGNRIIVSGPFYLNTLGTRTDQMTLRDLYRNKAMARPLYQHYSKQVLGGEAALWTEITTPQNIDAALYPRLMPIAQEFWNPAAMTAAHWPDFARRVRAQERWLAFDGVRYGPAGQDVVAYHLSFEAHRHRSRLRRWRISAMRGFRNSRLRYTRNAAEPTNSSPSFLNYLDLYEPATITVAPFRDGLQYGGSRQFRFVSSLVLGDRVTFATAPTRPGGGNGSRLTDGVLGAAGFCPSCYPLFNEAWDGWQGTDMDVTVHAPSAIPIRSVEVPFLAWSSSGILLPRRVSVEVSNDGKAWKQLGVVRLHPRPDSAHDFIRVVTVKLSKPIEARYIRVKAMRYGKRLHGTKTWILCDQIIVH